MSKPIFRLLLSFTIFLLSFTLVKAQTNGKTDEAYMADIGNLLLQSSFVINAPDSGYTFSRDGKGVRISQEKLKIYISIYTVPSPFARMIADTRKNINISGYTFLDSAHLKSISGYDGFRIVQEVVAHDPGIYEVQIVMVSIFDYKGYSVMVTSVYPKNLDKEWREKLITSSLTLREENNK